MLKRSAIAISVDSSIRAQVFSAIQLVQQNRIAVPRPFSTTDAIVGSQCDTRGAPHRAVSKW
jgi:hypothetical protein